MTSKQDHKQDQTQDYILSIDDVEDNLILVKKILETQGYRVDSVTNGKTALEKIALAEPDLILLDISMPEMDGYEVTKRIRNNTNLSYIPILLITGFDESSAVEGLDAGADDFIRKPFDIGELLARVRSLLRLKHSIDDQKRMLRQREDFVSRLTHDLRTPLVAADRMLNLFLQEVFCPLSGEMKQAIQTMIRSNHNLLTMVNTLLEVYRFEDGRKTLNFVSCNLITILSELITELEPLATEKNITLKFNTQGLNQIVAEKQPGIITGDELEVRRIFSNIIGNAIKFTDVGTVEISISENSNTDGDNQVIVKVIDTGYGIPLEDQSRIFERFKQGKHKRSGTGLGLHLTRLLVIAHQGAIEVNSQPGKGSTFTVKFPKFS